MVLRVDVVEAALRARYGADPVALRDRRRVIALTPGGRLLDDALVDELAAEPALTLLCGRYEGFDERILEHFASDRVSIGRYVLAGGELPAMVVCDAVLRKLPGALGHDDSARRGVVQPRARRRARSTRITRGRPSYRGWDVPEVLLSGHHANIARMAPRAEPRGAARDARRPDRHRRGPATISRRAVCRTRGTSCVRLHRDAGADPAERALP